MNLDTEQSNGIDKQKGGQLDALVNQAPPKANKAKLLKLFKAYSDAESGIRKSEEFIEEARVKLISISMDIVREGGRGPFKFGGREYSPSCKRNGEVFLRTPKHHNMLVVDASE